MRRRAAAPESFDSFFERMSIALLKHGYFLTADRSTAEDLAQDTLVQVWRHWDAVSRYDSPEAWARRVLRNLAINDSLRHRRVAIGLREVASPVTSGPDERRVMLAAVLRQLPENQCHAVVLHDGFGLPLEEVARQLGAPLGTVKSWVHRGRAAVVRLVDGEKT
jgi:RNA polymerase sigma-70 factor (ECF subfamily)